jgi:thioredoxin 1
MANIASLSSPADLQYTLASANDNQITMVNFTAAWCKPCKKIKPTVQYMATKYASRIKVYTVDVDTSPELVSHFEVHTMPTFIFFKNNKVVYVLQGASNDLLTQAFEILFAVTS